eukprot:scaffold9614_cov118-Isochrysis_galbana.AAC.3
MLGGKRQISSTRSSPPLPPTTDRAPHDAAHRALHASHSRWPLTQIITDPPSPACACAGHAPNQSGACPLPMRIVLHRPVAHCGPRASPTACVPSQFLPE